MRYEVGALVRRDRNHHFGRIALIMVLTMFLVSTEAVAQVPPTQFLTPAELPRERVVATMDSIREWRDAARVSGGEWHTINLGEAEEEDIVRLGLHSPSGDSIDIEVYVADRRVSETVYHPTSGWNDYSFQLSVRSEPGDWIHVRLRSEASFYISNAVIVRPNTGKNNIIIFMIDTLRQDHLGCYGYERNTSPNIDRFALDAVRFTQLVPSSSWTRPSVASLLTSTYPNVHGAQDRGDSVRDGLTWLADVIETTDYETHGIMTNVNCLPVWGFGNDFDRYVDMDSKSWLELNDDEAVERGMAYVESVPHQPFFLYLHTIAPHEPYDPPDETLRMFERDAYSADPKFENRERTVDKYDAEIRYIDELFGDFVKSLKDSGLYDSSLIIVLSDHGEEFWDHGGTSHGKTLYEEQLRVPFLMKLPEGRYAGRTVDTLFEMIDIAPTLLDAVGMPPEPNFHGTSIMPLLKDSDEQQEGDRIGFASLHLDDKSMSSVKTTVHKLIRDVVVAQDVFYNIQEDPGEHRPLEDEPGIAPAFNNVLSERSALGSEGLHILITHDSERDILVEANIAGVPRDDLEVLYPESQTTVNETAEGVKVSARMREADPNRPSARWRRALRESEILRGLTKMNDEGIVTEQDNMKLIADVPLSETVVITIAVEGEPVDASDAEVGYPAQNFAIDNLEISMGDVIGPPNAYDPAALPRGFGVYIWYVPATDSLSEEEMDEDMIEALRALGYVD